MIRIASLFVIAIVLVSTTASAQLAGITFLNNNPEAGLATIDLYVTQSNQTQKVEDVSYQAAINLNSIFIFADIEVTFDVAPGNSAGVGDKFASYTFTPGSDVGYMLVSSGVRNTDGFAANPDGEEILATLEIFPVPFFSGPTNEIGTMFIHGATDMNRGDARIRGRSAPIGSDIVYNAGTPALVNIERELGFLDFTKSGDAKTVYASFEVNFGSISSESIVLVLSGYKTPGDNNSSDQELVLLGILESGSVIKYPLVKGSQTAKVQIIHNSADPTFGVMDVYFDDVLTVDNFRFRNATGFSDVAAGAGITIGFAPFGSSDVDDTVASVKVQPLRAGRSYHFVINGVLDTATFASNPTQIDISMSVQVVEGALTESSFDGGATSVRAAHGSTDTDSLTVRGSSGVEYLSSAQYPAVAESYIQVPAETDTLWVIDQQTQQPVRGWIANLAGNKRATVLLASGFADPSANNDGEKFKLILIDANGTVRDNLKEIDPPTVSVQEELFSGHSLSVSPNPAGNVISVTIPGGVIVGNGSTVELYSTSGSLISSSTIATDGTDAVTIPTSGITNGAYVLSIRSATGAFIGSTQVVISR